MPQASLDLRFPNSVLTAPETPIIDHCKVHSGTNLQFSIREDITIDELSLGLDVHAMHGKCAAQHNTKHTPNSGQKAEVAFRVRKIGRDRKMQRFQS